MNVDHRGRSNDDCQLIIEMQKEIKQLKEIERRKKLKQIWESIHPIDRLRFVSVQLVHEQGAIFEKFFVRLFHVHAKVRPERGEFNRGNLFIGIIVRRGS